MERMQDSTPKGQSYVKKWIIFSALLLVQFELCKEGAWNQVRQANRPAISNYFVTLIFFISLLWN